MIELQLKVSAILTNMLIFHVSFQGGRAIKDLKSDNSAAETSTQGAQTWITDSESFWQTTSFTC